MDGDDDDGSGGGSDDDNDGDDDGDGDGLKQAGYLHQSWNLSSLGLLSIMSAPTGLSPNEIGHLSQVPTKKGHTEY